MCVNLGEVYLNQEVNLPKLQETKDFFYQMQKVLVPKKTKWDTTLHQYKKKLRSVLLNITYYM